MIRERRRLRRNQDADTAPGQARVRDNLRLTQYPVSIHR